MDVMTVEPTIGRPMVQDELQAIVSMLCTRFPERNPGDVELLVTDVYQRLSGDARVRAHLIPLTLNRCRRLLAKGWSAGPKDHTGSDVRPQTTAE
jgi:hypothetical protein